MDIFEKIVTLPSYVTAYGWIPFVAAILLSLLFSFLYVRYFWKKSEQDRFSAIIATLGITIALLSAFLLPVDVFLVSYMKDSNGAFKDWATNTTREALQNSVTYTYYSLCGIIFFYAFFVLPFAYFMFEERDEDRRNSKVVLTALCYTCVFVFVISALLIAGLLIPFKELPPQNSTQWDKIEFLIKELYQNRGRDAVSFVVNILTIYGMLNLTLYTGFGMSSLPVTMIKGFRSMSDEQSILWDTQATTQTKINDLKSKQARRPLSSRETSTLTELEEEEILLSKRAQFLQSERKKFLYKCYPCFKIFSGILGCIGLVFSLLLFISLLIGNIDKVMNSMDMKMGYVLKENLLPNPLDYIMVQAQKVFPLDYVLFFCVIVFLLMCTVSGIRYLGISCLCIRVYKIRPSKTPPQALIMFAFILMFTVFAFHILVYSVIPTYTTFGSQSYCKMDNGTCVLSHCTLKASADDCVMTRSAAFFLSFAYKAWMFAAIYFWLSWALLVSFIFSFILLLVRSRTSLVELAVDKDDFDDSDEEPTRI